MSFETLGADEKTELQILKGLEMIVHWTKLLWIGILLYKNKTSQGTIMIFLSFKLY